MDNSRITQEGVQGTAERQDEQVEKRRGELTRIIEAIRSVAASKEWGTLRELLFDDAVRALERRIISESSATNVKLDELYRLQGQLVWARKYADFDKLGEFFMKQLEGIKKQ